MRGPSLRSVPTNHTNRHECRKTRWAECLGGRRVGVGVGIGVNRGPGFQRSQPTLSLQPTHSSRLHSCGFVRFVGPPSLRFHPLRGPTLVCEPDHHAPPISALRQTAPEPEAPRSTQFDTAGPPDPSRLLQMIRRSTRPPRSPVCPTPNP